jgi:hypothetical protein
MHVRKAWRALPTDHGDHVGRGACARTGLEILQSLGYAIVAGPIVSQAITLTTTPVVYLYLNHVSDLELSWHSAAAAKVLSATLPVSSAMTIRG